MKKIFIKLEVTIARKVLPHRPGIKAACRNLLNKAWFPLNRNYRKNRIASVATI